MSITPVNLIPRQSKPWSRKTSLEKYNTMGSWFLGPRGENAEIVKEKMNHIIDIVKTGRVSIWPNDAESITQSMIDSPDFKNSINDLNTEIDALGQLLADHSAPFYSPRYAAHMNSDISMSATLGYILAQQYNQNNAAPEGGPFTSYIEWIVGQQLCHMLGYNSYFMGQDEDIVGWGHITAGGTIANLESMWIARNLKYYPLALKQTMASDEPFAFVSPTFNVTLCTGIQKNFYSCETWELLNLSPTEIANIPTRLANEYGISPEVLANRLEKFSIQSVGKDKLDADFNITKPIQYLISLTNHYSWPKSCAITGIGRDNLITIGVDHDVRMNTELLRNQLEQRLRDKQAVYCVVVVAGTTEHGAVDPLTEVLEIRKSMEQQGMSFMIHVDAAWGGYFATKAKPQPRDGPENYAFSIPLNDWSFKQLFFMRHADTITLDPHKSGYVPYAAGSLCLRDGRHRFLTTWTSSYINTNSENDISMAIYGVEGSKPGASPVAVYLSHHIIGLDSGGYADLLGTAMLTGIKMYGHWATMSLRSETLTVTPLNMLPIERQTKPPTPEEIRKEQETIRVNIVDRKNYELESDPDAMALVRKLGSDTMINAFACNFKVHNVINTDVVEANFLNTRLYQLFSIQSVKDDLRTMPIIILRTEFKQAEYLETLDKFKSRMGLSGPEDLVALSNVSMSPFPTVGQLLTEITDAFQAMAEDEIKNCLVRIVQQPAIHSFVVQGTDVLYLTYLPMFNVVNHRAQVIATGFLQEAAMNKYIEAKKQKPDVVFTIHSKSHLYTLDEILTNRTFIGDIYEGFPDIYGFSPFLEAVEITITVIYTHQSLDRKNLGNYPTEMPFAICGASKTGYHIDHVLKSAPNAQLTASGVTIDVTPLLHDDKQYTLTFDEQIEWAMQPFTYRQPPAFFKPKATLKITVHEKDSESVSTGTLTLPSNSGDIFVDYDYLNEEIAADIYVMVPVDSTKTEEQIKTDVDNISQTLVKLFQKSAITWAMNVPSAIGRELPIAKEYSVTLGVPDTSTVKPEAYFAIVSRFVSKLPSDSRTRKFAQEHEWVAQRAQIEVA